MTDASKANGHRQQANTFTLETMVCMIDLAERDPALGTVDLGRRLANRVRKGRGKELVTHQPRTINNWKRQEDKFWVTVFIITRSPANHQRKTELQ
jgi:hypothetical protein